MISFVRLSRADAPLLSQIGAVTLVQSHGHSAPEPVMQEYISKCFNEEACKSELSDGQNIFYAAFYKGKPAGYLKLVFRCPNQNVPLAPVTKLERLYLLHEFCGIKLGHQLLQQAIALSKAEGEEGMWLNVWKGNERAIRFYQKQGFETVGESSFVLTASHANPNWVMLLRY